MDFLAQNIGKKYSRVNSITLTFFIVRFVQFKSVLCSYFLLFFLNFIPFKIFYCVNKDGEFALRVLHCYLVRLLLCPVFLLYSRCDSSFTDLVL